MILKDETIPRCQGIGFVGGIECLASPRDINDCSTPESRRGPGRDISRSYRRMRRYTGRFNCLSAFGMPDHFMVS